MKEANKNAEREKFDRRAKSRDKGEGDVPSSYQLMSAYEDRSRHLAGETLLFYDATAYGSEVIPKSFSTCKIHTNIVNKVSKSQNFTSFKNIKI